MNPSIVSSSFRFLNNILLFPAQSLFHNIICIVVYYLVAIGIIEDPFQFKSIFLLHDVLMKIGTFSSSFHTIYISRESKLNINIYCFILFWIKFQCYNNLCTLKTNP